MPAADPRSFIKLDEVNEARIKRGIIRGSMMIMLMMVKRREIRKRMRTVEQLISLAGTYGWGALARK